MRLLHTILLGGVETYWS